MKMDFEPILDERPRLDLTVIEIELAFLRNFLEHTTADAGCELDAIEHRRQAGEYERLGNYEHALDYPFVRIEIACRAVGYELVALVERQLHRLAHEPWIRSTSHKGPKNLQELGEVSPESLSQMRMVSDVPFGQILELIEKHFELRLGNIEGWEDINRLRHAVNAFKHRGGMKHHREINWRDKRFMLPQRHEITQDQAYESINNVRRFFRSVARAIRGPVPREEEKEAF